MPVAIKPAHPGEILREEFIIPLGLTPYKVAKAIHVNLPRVNDIVNETRAISPEMGVRLSTFFGTTPQFWINLQADYDRRMAEAKIHSEIQKIVPMKTAQVGSHA